ncbi:hypothetical protein TVAG_257620 [Trichomonas vaginalis G3]|uniref:Eukaryotic initiation factor 4E family protein n=1 Tax=Trichomonas vaginalis (strain ATCC PRA-98 / G3) TaxID=412133 RepID=A2F4E3_TRIV3|nr:translation initiation factor protein [Trichomonas vaginalis G3]EAY00208.1 hypothetical protein TVAG_257620 [Trichomonas vaginalis G3]KAI5492902.1 translation initiation factor protein [Trichomonas vaginalis G3]|eukprot:XP_001313137.1 hypothetical protein [Trichomonas vaginalis G3]
MADIQYNFIQEWQFWVITCRFTDKTQYEIEPIIKVRSKSKFAEYLASLPDVLHLQPKQNSKISLAFFSDNIQPAWEDKANTEGGCMYFTLQDKLKERAQDLWEYLLAAAVSGELNNWLINDVKGNEICGVIVSPKVYNAYSFEIWTRSNNQNNQRFQAKLQEELKKLLNLESDLKIQWLSHRRKK